MKKLILVILLGQGMALSQSDRGVVSGRIRSGDGAPAAGIRVAAMAAPEPNRPAAAAVLASIGQTDSGGNYRLTNVSPGRYYITAGLIDTPTYFPGSINTSTATVVTVTAGATVADVDFTLARPLSVKVSGRVTGLATSQPSTSARVTLLPRTTPSAATLSASVKVDGTFEFPNVPPGAYGVQMSLPPLILKQPATIVVDDHDVTGVELVAVNTDVATRRQGVEQAWSLAGAWGGVVGDSQSGTIYASGPGRSLYQIDLTGKIQREIPLVTAPFVRLAHLSPDGRPAFLAFGTWSSSVRAVDADGTQLWTYDAGAIDDVWAMDLDGDKLDEVIVGFNGAVGMHVLDSKGKLLWKDTTIGNVWHVSAGSVRGQGTQVVTTSSGGKVHVFSAGGPAGRQDLNPGLYANMVRVGMASEKDPAATIFIMGAPSGPSTSGSSAVALAALSGDGTRKWSIDLPANSSPSVYSAFLAPGKPWLAVGMQGGLVYVVDTERGTAIAVIDGQGIRPDVTWATTKDDSGPLLIVSSSTRLTAFRINLKEDVGVTLKFNPEAPQ